MSKAHRGLHITLPSSAENVAVVRHAVAGVAEALGMDEAGVADLKTIVTEACMNVVVHAYAEDPGPMEVEAYPEDGYLTLVVRDFGAGIRPRAEIERPSLRLGLSLIAALSHSFEISGGLDRGTRITMRLSLSADAPEAGSGAGPREVPADATSLVVAEPKVLRPVLARVIGALAARRDVTIDRLSDAVLLTDAISEGAATAFSDGQVRIDLWDGADGIDLRLGPMEQGAGARLRKGLELPAVGGTLEDLADQLTVEQRSDGEYLVVRFSAARG